MSEPRRFVYGLCSAFDKSTQEKRYTQNEIELSERRRKNNIVWMYSGKPVKYVVFFRRSFTEAALKELKKKK